MAATATPTIYRPTGWPRPRPSWPDRVSKTCYTARSRTDANRLSELRRRLQPDRPGQPPRAVPQGVPDELIASVIDTRPFLAQKRAAVAAHASQLADTMWVRASEQDFANCRPRVLHLRRRGARGPAGD